MKALNLKRVVSSAFIVWVLGVSAFVGSYYLPIMEDAEVQANWVLTITLIPATILGAYFYNRKSAKTNGLLLGASMFLLTIVLDALITVPAFIIPAGGSHASFFGDPGFWMLGVEYVLVVGIANYAINTRRGRHL
jgi:hypothetical protein